MPHKCRGIEFEQIDDHWIVFLLGTNCGYKYAKKNIEKTRNE